MADPTSPQQTPQSYEQARDELAEVVRRLEAGGTTLEEALALWERGEALATACQQWLDGARARLHAVTDPAPPAHPGPEHVPASRPGRAGDGSEA
jgi:exodeoxyribonuclease VII small subunit